MAVWMCIIASGNCLPPKPKTRCCLAQVPRGWTLEWWPSGGVRVCDLVTSGVASSPQKLPGCWVGLGRDLEGLRVSPTASLLSPTGQHLSDAFAQVNPLRKVPALKDGDFTLAER